MRLWTVAAALATTIGASVGCGGAFAESPNRVFVLMRGELPVLQRPTEVPYSGVGPSISFPVFVVDADGNITEEWTQWDPIFRRPHSVFINPFPDGVGREGRAAERHEAEYL